MHSRIHRMIEDQVFVLSCWNVFAVTVPTELGLVLRIHAVSHPAIVLLPMP
jgi:hypothetical protein